MGFFDRPGEYDENDFWWMLRSPQYKALDQAMKARQAIASMPAPMVVAGADERVARLEKQVATLQANLLSLGLYTRTIVGLLLEKNVITLEEFQSKMQALDLEDGKLDGR